MTKEEMLETIENHRQADTLPAVTLAKNERPWGEASEHRGERRSDGPSYTDLAVEFVAQHPIGTRFWIEAFDQWVADHGLLKMPPKAATKDKQSDGWKAHLMRRHEAKKVINSAGCHPRLLNLGATPFWISPLHGSGGEYIVRAPQETAARGELGKKVVSLTTTLRKRLDYLMQSTDWNGLSASAKAKVEESFYGSEDFQKTVNLQADILATKYARAEAALLAEGVRVPELEGKNDDE